MKSDTNLGRSWFLQTLSRISSADKEEILGLRVSIHNLVSITDQRLTSLQEETANDLNLQKVIVHVQSGWPKSVKSVDADIRGYWSVRDNLTVVNGLLLWGSRIVIPSCARERTLRSIHDGHQGEVKCTLRAKDSVYWPCNYKGHEKHGWKRGAGEGH